jgi:hypothetical protein
MNDQPLPHAQPHHRTTPATARRNLVDHPEGWQTRARRQRWPALSHMVGLSVLTLGNFGPLRHTRFGLVAPQIKARLASRGRHSSTDPSERSG